MAPFSQLLPRAALLACALAVIALASDFVSAQGQGPARRLVTEMLDGHEVVAGEVLLRFRDEPRAALDQARVALETGADHVEVVGRRGLRRLHSRRHGTGALLAMLRANPDVELVAPNYVIRVNATPNDPLFNPHLWGLWNFGQAIPYPAGTPGTPGVDIDALAAWDTQTGSRTHVIGIIDSGIDYNHPDLAANIWSAPSAFTVTAGGVAITCAAGTHGFNAINDTCDPMDDNNHGTHVAGTIGATGNNGVGLAGVNWVASMMGLKFLDSTGSGTLLDAMQAIEFAIQVKAVFAGSGAANIRVLNNSWGGGGYYQPLEDLIDLANARDMLFVASAGNGGADGVGDDNDPAPQYPASYSSPNVIAVAATTNQDLRASFSNFGATSVDLGAPGLDIGSTVRSNQYAYFSGTSMAAPHVSGAAALALAECPWMTTSDVKTLLLGTIDPTPAMAGITVTGGRLNVNSAVRACGVQSVTLTPSLASPRPTGTTITWTANPVGGKAPYQYKWWFFDGANWLIARDWSASNTFAWTPGAAGAFQFAVWVRSSGNNGNSPEASAAQSYTITVPPGASVALTANKTAPQAPGTSITWTAAPSGGTAPYQYKWWFYDGATWIIVSSWTSSNTLIWTPATAGPYMMGVWIRSAGNTVDAPEASAAVPFTIAIPPGSISVALAANKASPQAPGSTITWTASASGGVAPLQYKWFVFDGVNWAIVQDWSPANTFAWTPSSPNANHYVGVWVKSATNPADTFEAWAAVPFTIQ